MQNAKSRSFQTPSAKILSTGRCVCIASIFLLLVICSAAEKPGPPESTAKLLLRSGVPVAHNYWAIESAAEREKLPLYKTIPAARPDELTPANGYPKPETFLSWHRSHGDNGGTRYSGL